MKFRKLRYHDLVSKMAPLLNAHRGTSAIGTKDSIALILELTATKDDTHDLNEVRSWFTAHTSVGE